MKLLTRITNVFDRILGVLAIWACVLLTLTMLGVVVEIIMRAFADHPISWMVEITEYCLLWITFLGAAWLLKKEGHVKMDLILNKLNPKFQTLLNISTSMIGIIVWLVITWFSAMVTWNYFETGGTFATERHLLKWPVFAIIPIGSFLLLTQLMRRTYGYLKGWRVAGREKSGFFKVRIMR